MGGTQLCVLCSAARFAWCLAWCTGLSQPPSSCSPHTCRLGSCFLHSHLLHGQLHVLQLLL